MDRRLTRFLLCTPQAEERLRHAIFSACYQGSTLQPPSVTMLQFMQQPVLELRIALYRFMSAMLLRPWFAAEVCGHAGLLSRLLDATSEEGSAACGWRHSAVLALWSTCRLYEGNANGGMGLDADTAHHAALLQASLAPVAAAIQQGAFGRPEVVTLHDTHLVATVPR